MRKTYKNKLYPNNKTEKIIDQVLKCCSWLYNYLLEKFREKDKCKERQLTKTELQSFLPKIKSRYPFLKQVQSHIFLDVMNKVFEVWKRYEKIKKLDSKKKYPNFKPHHRYDSFTYCQPINKIGCGYKLDNSPLTKKTENRKLRLSLGRQNNHNIQIAVNLKLSRNIEGDVKTLTIKRKNNRYYACFSCDEITPQPLPKTNKSIGIDVNLKKDSYLTLSNGKKYKHPQCYKKSEKLIKQTQQRLSNKIQGSQNWLDAKLQLAKKWEKVVNQSKWYSYQIANELVRDYDNIAIEKLKIRNMIKNHKLAKSISQARWGILFQVISEAAEIATRGLVRVNPRNTTQTCSDCGSLAKEKLKLNQRTFECWNCNLELDRDINSARNILNLGFDRSLPSEIGGETLKDVL